MDPFDTSKYNIQRKEDGTLVRVDGLGGETPEMTIDYYDSQIAYHEQVVANLEAQKMKLADWLVDNPEVEADEPAELQVPENAAN
ncbi:hypothetical protein [Rhodococcus sp. YH3-3]|uniref:hypothetical protein n=1 Tax=Rhodococcus sp. YH3-3 TaxID=1803579 RepID=UPI000ADA1756|nr:hypothetical protein [Rhodococcus sp. YH3-3]